MSTAAPPGVTGEPLAGGDAAGVPTAAVAVAEDEMTQSVVGELLHGAVEGVDDGAVAAKLPEQRDRGSDEVLGLPGKVDRRVPSGAAV